MRKLAVFMMISVDGYFARNDGALDWHVVDEEFNRFAIEQLDQAELLLFGRNTYELMASYWPTQAGQEDEPRTAERMNRLPKLVFSKTLGSADWQNTQLVKEDAAEVLRGMKTESGGELLVLGSSILTASLLNAGLIDELRLMVNPVLLPAGRTVFSGLDRTVSLELLRSKLFESGNILLYYRPVAAD